MNTGIPISYAADPKGYQREYRRKNAERLKVQDALWRANNKERKAKNDAEYARANIAAVRLNKRRYYYKHKEKVLAAERARRAKNSTRRSAVCAAYYIANKEAVSARNKAWRDKNKTKKLMYGARRRALEKSAFVEDISVWATAQKAKKRVRCYHCRKIVAGSRIQFDHLVPIAKGGAHASHNVVPSCPTCNRRKCAKLPNDFISSGQLLLI